MRSLDFQRIYDEFCKYYKDHVKGESEYYSWLKALQLNEAKPYGSARESFQWSKHMLNFLKEDADNKYYGIIVGLPIRSMNGNIYHERDLIAAALSLKGKHPSLNHKDQFWFNESNPYGVLTVVDAKYEDGAVEALLKVPKSAVCPICNGAKMTELIDKQHIVNVSLEGTMNGAFEFSDPPFTLLTSNVLPGIPLARIKPLETILSEAFTGTKSTRSNHKMKISLKVKEDKNQKVANDNSTVNTKSSTDPDFGGTWGTPLTSDRQIDDQIDNAKAVYGTPAVSDNYNMKVSKAESQIKKKEESECPPGMKMNPETGECEKIDTVEQECPEGQKRNPETGACEPISTEANEPNYQGDAPTSAVGKTPDYQGDMPTGPSKTKAPTFKHDIPAGAPTSWPAPVQVGNVMGTAPVEGLAALTEERVRRIKAEYKSTELKKNLEYVESVWEEKYRKLTEENANLASFNVQKDALINELRSNKTSAEAKIDEFRSLHSKELQEAKIELEDFKARYGNATRESTKYSKLVEDLQIAKEDLEKKYHGALSSNLKLSKDLTKANEDYLEIAKKLEETQESLGRARNEAKKILKINV